MLESLFGELERFVFRSHRAKETIFCFEADFVEEVFVEFHNECVLVPSQEECFRR